MPRQSPELRRQSIVSAALSLFQRDGFEAVRVDDILEEVGLSKGGFYHHFKSREDILRQLVVTETRMMVDRLDQSLIEADPASALTQLFQKGSVDLDGEPGVLETLSSFAARSIYLDELERQLVLHLKPYLVQVIDRGIAMGVFRTVDGDATAEIFLAVSDHGNRASILGKLNTAELKTYNATAIQALASHLGIEDGIQKLFHTNDPTDS